MKKWRVPIILLAVVVLLLAGYFFYTRPMTLAQLYPELVLEDCDEIACAYYFTTDPEIIPAQHAECTVEADSEKFRQLCALFREQKYRRSLKNLLRMGRRQHSVRLGDILWSVDFRFGKTVFEDGHAGYRGYFQFSTMFGELELNDNGQLTTCFVADQKAWSRSIHQLLRE